MAKLHLLKVITQAVFIIDDGERLTEQLAEPVVVPAAEWPTYPTTAFAEGVEALRQQVEGPTPPRPEHNGRVTKSPKARAR